MGLEDLDINVRLNTDPVSTSLRKLRLDFQQTFKSISEVKNALVEAGKSGIIPLEQIDIRLKNISATARHAERGLLSMSYVEKQWARNVREAVVQARKEMRALRLDTLDVAKAAGSVASSTALIHIPRRQSADAGAGRSSGGGGDSGGGVNFVRVTQAAGQLAILSRVDGTLQRMGNTMRSVATSTNFTATAMERFRIGMAAPPVDPKLNLLKKTIEAVSAAAAGGVDKLRGVFDAIASDIPGTAQAGVKGLRDIGNELDKSSATISKHVSALHKLQGGLNLVATVFPFARGAIDSVRGPLDSITEKADHLANKFDEGRQRFNDFATDMRGQLYVATGRWEALSGSADTFARSQFYALLPWRLLKREWEGGVRIFKLVTHSLAWITTPIHSMVVGLQKSRAEWRDLNERLPKVKGGLDLGTRAFRLFAQSAYIAGTSVRAMAAAVRFTVQPVVSVTKALWTLATPIRSVTTGIIRLTGVQNTWIGKTLGMQTAADQAAIAMRKMERSVGGSSGGLGGMLSMMGLVRGGLLAAGVAAVAMGAKSAAGAELSAVSYGTMLHDMEQGRALLATVQGWKGAPLFDTKDVEDSTRALLKAGIAPAMITDKLTELGNIASVTKTPIEDLARMYQQGATVGKFGYGQINDMAMRGIDIWHGLADATGKSVPEVQKLAEAGQIGVAQMDAALAKLTTGTGIYAGALDNVAETSSGMFATMVNNTKMAWTAFMGAGLEAFKPVLKMGVAVTGGIATGLRRLAPIASIIGGALSDMFGAIGRIGGNVFGNLLGNGQSLFGGILKVATTVFTTIRFFWQNFEGVAKWAFESFKLHALTTFNDFLFFFTNKAPAAVKHYFEQVKNLMLGGQWQPLGPMPERAMTEAERKLQERADALGAPLAVRLDEMLTEAEKAMADTPAMKALSDKASAYNASAPDFSAASSASSGANENKAINVRSAESQSIISQLLNRGQNLQTKAHNAQIKMADDVKKVAKAAERGVPLMARAWA